MLDFLDDFWISLLLSKKLWFCTPKCPKCLSWNQFVYTVFQPPSNRSMVNHGESTWLEMFCGGLLTQNIRKPHLFILFTLFDSFGDKHADSKPQIVREKRQSVHFDSWKRSETNKSRWEMVRKATKVTWISTFSSSKPQVCVRGALVLLTLDFSDTGPSQWGASSGHVVL